MNDEQKRAIDARHEQAKQHGIKFFPDIIYKDMIAAFGVFVLLLLPAVFLGVKPEPPADPNDAAYVPRPEWYFLFLLARAEFVCDLGRASVAQRRVLLQAHRHQAVQRRRKERVLRLGGAGSTVRIRAPVDEGVLPWKGLAPVASS